MSESTGDAGDDGDDADPRQVLHDRYRLIRKHDGLLGTCYVELLPGAYDGVHWSSRSVYLTPEAFALVEPIFRELPQFDFFGPTPVSARQVQQVLGGLEQLRLRVEACADVAALLPVDHASTYGSESRKDLGAVAWSEARVQVRGLLEELACWVRAQADQGATFEVLGL